jgi:hypothetical protein
VNTVIFSTIANGSRSRSSSRSRSRSIPTPWAHAASWSRSKSKSRATAWSRSMSKTRLWSWSESKTRAWSVWTWSRTDPKVPGKELEQANKPEEPLISKKDDSGKTSWDLVDLELLSGIAKVREFGNIKYEKNSWKSVENGYRRYYAAAIRHLAASQYEEMDTESKLPHLWHCLTNLYFMEYFRRKGVE